MTLLAGLGPWCRRVGNGSLQSGTVSHSCARKEEQHWQRLHGMLTTFHRVPHALGYTVRGPARVAFAQTLGAGAGWGAAACAAKVADLLTQSAIWLPRTVLRPPARLACCIPALPAAVAGAGWGLVTQAGPVRQSKQAFAWVHAKTLYLVCLPGNILAALVVGFGEVLAATAALCSLVVSAPCNAVGAFCFYATLARAHSVAPKLVDAC